MISLLASDNKYSVSEACSLFGYSRQAYYNSLKVKEKGALQEDIIVDFVKEIRKDMPCAGGRKLHKTALEQLPDHLLMGRDAFFDFLSRWGLQIRHRHRGPKTTNSRHYYRKYPNLIREFIPDAPNQLYVSDITYIEIERKKFYYLALITDAYSRKIVGWYLSKTLKAEGCIKAMQMALRENEITDSLIHHSDRGSQYCCGEYVALLNSHNVSISMTENGDPLENAIAERVNGILKNEWFKHMQLGSIKEARKEVARVINLYNKVRKHMSINMLTPEQAHQCKGVIPRVWKNYYKPPLKGIIQNQLEACN